MRLFIAIFLPEVATASLEGLSRRVASPRLRWVPTASLHLTLKFLGETEPRRKPDVEAALERVTAAFPRFRVGLSGGGAFPNDRRPRVFWVGISGETSRLSGLALETIAATTELGFPVEERAFVPHLTVARCRSDARCLPEDGASFAAAAGAIDVPPFSVDAVHLVRSHLSASGSRYESLKSFPLAA